MLSPVTGTDCDDESLGSALRKRSMTSLVLVLGQCADVEGAKWIWNRKTGDRNVWVALRKTFSLPGAPGGRINARIAVDSKYWLYVNDELVVYEGGVKRGPNWDDTYVDNVDIGPYLRVGKNVISIMAWYFGHSAPGQASHHESGQAALFFSAEVGGTRICSDESWKALGLDAFGLASIQPCSLPESSILFDARKEIPGWELSSFDDSAWPAAAGFGGEGSLPWGALVNRSIPFWTVGPVKAFPLSELKMEKVANLTRYTVRFPTEFQFTPYLKVDAGTAGAGKLIKLYTDRLYAPPPQYTGPMAEYITRQGEQSHESLGWLAGEKLFVEVPDSVTAIELGYRRSSYAATFEGSFVCEDAFLNKLWIMARDTLFVDIRDNMMDGAERERTQYCGDGSNEIHTSFYCLSASANLLIRKTFDQTIAFVRDGVIPTTVPVNMNRWSELPDESLSGVMSFHQYYEYTGDHGHFPGAYRVSQEYLLTKWTMGPDGVAEHRKGTWDWSDWGVHQDWHLMQNCFYYIALDRTLKMGSVLGLDPQTDATARELEARKKSIATHFDSVFWNAGGFYRSPGDSITDDRGNALAVMAGLASPDKYPKILEVLKTVKWATPGTEKFVLEALYRMGYEDAALIRMKERWAEMVNSGDATLWELWKVSEGEHDQGWCGGPLIMLSMFAAGVSPVEPGFKKFKVAPQPSTIKNIRCVVPSVRGAITVTVNSETAGSLVLGVTVPRGTQAVIGVPLIGSKSGTTVKVAGVVIWENGKVVANDSGLAAAGSDERFAYFESASDVVLTAEGGAKVNGMVG
jgi:hypothetical protein